MYDRILYNAYVKVNNGLDYIHDVWGYGCPITVNTTVIEYTNEDEERIAFIRSRVRDPFSLKNYKYDDEETYIRFLISTRNFPYLKLPKKKADLQI
jgi:hypothetical protein